MRNADKPKNPSNRLWLVKFKGVAEPIEIEAEYRSMARHYAKCLNDNWRNSSIDNYKEIEYCRIKKD